MIRRCKRIWLWCNRVLFDVTVVRRIAIILCLFHSVHTRNRFSHISFIISFLFSFIISFARTLFLLDTFLLLKERRELGYSQVKTLCMVARKWLIYFNNHRIYRVHVIHMICEKYKSLWNRYSWKNIIYTCLLLFYC